MLHIIKTLEDQFAGLIKDDPVRPEIPLEQRVNDNSQIYVLKDAEGQPLAVTCVKFLAGIPKNVGELADIAVNTNTAVFYTIWSYAAGAGKKLIQQAQADIEREHPEVENYVTLSPKTDMARRFHHNNGAETYRENEDSINYKYKSTTH